MVVFILIDGLRPDGLEIASCPRLKELRDRGAWTMRASSVMPSVTLPCHTSIFHSVPPMRHGVTTNVWMPMARPLPGLFDLAKVAGKRCAFLYNWEELRDVARPGSLELSYFRNTSYQPGGDQIIADEAARVLPGGGYDFAFIYLGNVDVAGHDYGWMSDGYLTQVSIVDVALGTILDALPADTTYLVQSDHGGHHRHHGTDLPEDMTIPWLVAGAGIRAGHSIDAPVSLLDTAPTLARLIGVEPHREWEGRCIEEIFV